MPNAKVSLLCASAAALALPATGSAQIDPGVNYDPGSPAGKEYAIPLVEGRSDAAGTTDQREGANIPFGVGIGPPGGKGGKGADAGGAGKSDGRAGVGGTTGGRKPADEAVPGGRPRESRGGPAARNAD